MPFIPRTPELVRVQEVLETVGPGDVHVYARKTAAMAWGLIFMRTLWAARVEDAICGPYATEADARKAPGCEGATGPLAGLGTVLQARRGGPWVDWCRCGHRGGDHQAEGPRKARCMWADCDCRRFDKVTDKTGGAGWQPPFTLTPTVDDTTAFVTALMAEYSSPRDMARAVLKLAWDLLQRREGWRVLHDGHVTVGPVHARLRGEDIPFTPAGQWTIHPLNKPPARKGRKRPAA